MLTQSKNPVASKIKCKKKERKKKRVSERKDRIYTLGYLRDMSHLLRTEELTLKSQYISGSFSKQDRYEHIIGQLMRGKGARRFGEEVNGNFDNWAHINFHTVNLDISQPRYLPVQPFPWGIKKLLCFRESLQM